MVVRAPFSGVAISKDAQPGEMISPVSAGGGFTRTGICTIVDMSSLEIEVDVNESYINRVQPGQPVEAVLDAYPDWRIPAHVITTCRRPIGRRRRCSCASASTQLDPRILPDMGVKVSFLRDARRRPAGAAARRARCVPKAAIRTRRRHDRSCSSCNDDRVERRAVKRRRHANGDQVEVLAGVTRRRARGRRRRRRRSKDGDKVKVQ